MLTKSGNLSGLTNLKQSQLNLGVIESLLGEVFSTDNCTVISNPSGLAFREPQGLQICMGRVDVGPIPAQGSLGAPITFPAPFKPDTAPEGLSTQPQSALPHRFNSLLHHVTEVGGTVYVGDTGGGVTTAGCRWLAIGRWK